MSSTQVVPSDLDRGLAELESLVLNRPPNIPLAEYFNVLAAEDVLDADSAAQVVTTFNSLRYSVVPVDDSYASEAAATLALVTAKLTAMDAEERKQVADRVRGRIQRALAEHAQILEREHPVDFSTPSPMARPLHQAGTDRREPALGEREDVLFDFEGKPSEILLASPTTPRRRAPLPRIPFELAALAVLLTFFGGYFFREAANKVVKAGEARSGLRVPNPDESVPWVEGVRNLGNAEAQAQHYGKARLALELALPYSRENATELNNLAWYYLLPDKEAGTNPQRALKLVNRALEIRREWTSLDTAAEAHFQLGDFAEAIRLEKEAIASATERLSPRDSDFLQEQLEKFEAAEQTHRKPAPAAAHK